LHRSPVSLPAPSAAPPNASAAESAFLARDTLLRRGLVGSRAAPAPTRTASAPIPLQLTGQAAQIMPLRPAPRASIATPLPFAAAAPLATQSDIAQRMQDALDKYQRLEARHGGGVDL